MKIAICLFLIFLTTSCNKQPSISQSEFDNLIIIKNFTNEYGQLSCEITNNTKYDIFYDNDTKDKPNFITSELIFNKWENKGQWGCATGLVSQKFSSEKKVTLILPKAKDNPFIVCIFFYTSSADLYTLKRVFQNF